MPLTTERIDIWAPYDAFANASGAAKTPPLWAAPLSLSLIIVTAFAIWYALTPLVYAVAVAVGWPADPSDWRVGLVFDTMYFLSFIAVVDGWLVWIERRPRETIGLTAHSPGSREARWLGFGALWAALGWIIGAAVAPEAGTAVQDGLLFLTRPIASLIALAFLVPLVLVGVVAEEVFFRGWMLSILSARLGPAWGVLLSSLAFALAHVFPSELTDAKGVLSFVAFAVIGAVFAIIALKQRHLYGAMAFHAGFNLTLFVQSYGALDFNAARVYHEVLMSSRVFETAEIAAVALLMELALLLTLTRRWLGPTSY